MGPGETGESRARPKSSLIPAGSFECNARCGCAFGEVVWVSELRGGVAVHNAQSGELVTRVSTGNDNEHIHFKSMVVVRDEIWAGSLNGELHIFSARKQRWICRLLISGFETSAPITSLYFDGYSVIGGSETGGVVQWNSYSRRQVATFIAPAPITAVVVVAGLVVSGDNGGEIRMWDPLSGELATVHSAGKSGVTCLLNEPTTATVWVGRNNGTISVYTLSGKEEDASVGDDPQTSLVITLIGRVPLGKGAITSLLCVTGKVMATTYDRSVAVLCATTRSLLTFQEDAHSAFIYGVSAVYVAETARVWTIGNDSTVRIWDVPGYYVPRQSVPALQPQEQAKVAEGQKGILTVENAKLASCVAAAGAKMVDLRQQVQQLQNEGHELRLRLATVNDVMKEKDLEILAHKTRERELEELVKKLNKDAADANARSDAAQRECNKVRSDCDNATMEAARAKTNLSVKISEKAEVEQQLSAQRTQQHHMEIQIRDKNAELEHMRSEVERLHRMLEQETTKHAAIRQSCEKTLAENSTALQQEVDDLKRKTQLMSSLLCSLEYTILRNEEESRDMTALLNAYRRKVADKVADSHLSALLNLTMMRNPTRFVLNCDEHTKRVFRDRNGPLVRFFQTLQENDSLSYDKFVEYLQHPAAGLHNEQLFEKLMELAQKEGGDVDYLITFKKTLPILLDTLNPHAVEASKGGVGLSSVQQGACGAGMGQAGAHSTAAGETAVEVGKEGRTVTSGKEVEGDPSTNAAVESETDDPLAKQLKSNLDFILRTRQDLVEQLGLLVRRVKKGCQVVEVLVGSTAKDSPFPPVVRTSNDGLGDGARGHNVGSVANNILKELRRIVLCIVSAHLTVAERQQVGIQL
ncbi:hypothetical protein ERJ75_000756500 [Trypanosoma vivax]|nr:hypothetical protein TRVL_01130 [Trypanosoma vivax]KAH8614235.1 hypothetical protein ERJ75_000756500 [Trypanosoma vivax]